MLKWGQYISIETFKLTGRQLYEHTSCNKWALRSPSLVKGNSLPFLGAHLFFSFPFKQSFVQEGYEPSNPISEIDLPICAFLETKLLEI
jgi:hypothetical protein